MADERRRIDRIRDAVAVRTVNFILNTVGTPWLRKMITGIVYTGLTSAALPDLTFNQIADAAKERR